MTYDETLEIVNDLLDNVLQFVNDSHFCFPYLDTLNYDSQGEGYPNEASDVESWGFLGIDIACLPKSGMTSICYQKGWR